MGNRICSISIRFCWCLGYLSLVYADNEAPIRAPGQVDQTKDDLLSSRSSCTRFHAFANTSTFTQTRSDVILIVHQRVNICQQKLGNVIPMAFPFNSEKCMLFGRFPSIVREISRMIVEILYTFYKNAFLLNFCVCCDKNCLQVHFSCCFVHPPAKV